MNTKILSNDLKERNHINYQSEKYTAKDFTNKTFWYYTSVDTANKILLKKAFWISNINNMNDPMEVELHSKDAAMIHGLCFCHSDTEKIPMWYLYSGITGEGVRIGFTASLMLKFLRSIKTAYPVIDKTVDKNQKLIIDRDFELQAGWIYYKKSDGIIKYKGVWYNVEDYSEQNFERDNYFIKDYPWEYEKEFRIIVINKSSHKFDRLAIDIPNDIMDNLRITAGPELSGTEEWLSESGFQQYLLRKISTSQLKIKMDLL